MALQQWMEGQQLGQRTYNRPSRRGNYGEAIVAGRKREGSTIHILLDTSGSMPGELSKILGVIASFAEAMQIEQIHIMQCDTQITVNEWISPYQLKNYEIKGLGGSNMSPAMLYLAQDSEVESLLVLTDGAIYFPQEKMPYNVLWVITGGDSFEPGYGKVIWLKD